MTYDARGCVWEQNPLCNLLQDVCDAVRKHGPVIGVFSNQQARVAAVLHTIFGDWLEKKRFRSRFDLVADAPPIYNESIRYLDTWCGLFRYVRGDSPGAMVILC